MRLKHFIIQFYIFISLFSQNNPSIEVDSLLKESFQKFAGLQFLESSKIADQALQLSISSNYSKGKVIANLYIAKVLIEVGLNMDALKCIEYIYEEPFFIENVLFQVEAYRLKGRIYGSQRLYTLAKEQFDKQLSLSESISDPKKRELSKLWAYQNIEHLYSMQGVNDSIEVYQNLQEKQLSNFEEGEVYNNLSSLFASEGRLYMNISKFDEAEEHLQKSIDMLENYNSPYRYQTLQAFGDLEAARGNIDKAISFYYEALKNSSSLDIANTTRDLHKILADYMFENSIHLDKAKEHLKEYTLLNDSLERHNKRVVNAIFETITKDNNEFSAQKNKLFRHILIAILFSSFLIGSILIVRNFKGKRKLEVKNKQLTSKVKKIELLEEQLESNIFNDIIELAKSNSPEFLTLFGEGYPEFIEAMKQLDPTIRSSELYFCALAFLNFTTKDIANFTFVTIRAVQVRRNRVRKKYNIPSEVDFNEWFRKLTNGEISVD